MLLTALFLLSPLQAPPASAQAQPPFLERLRKTLARDYLIVPREITSITEDTLAEDTAANKGDMALNREDASKNLDWQAPGLRILAFELNPGERINLRHRRNLDLLLMSLVNTAKDNPLHDAINLVNKQSPARRTRTIDFRNTTDKPFLLFVRINGSCNAHYHLEIQRGN
jgi:hypothetical protein